MRTSTPPRAILRAGDADRERTVAVLRRHFRAGRLRTEELEERLAGALGARTFGDLDALTRDLPRPHRPVRPAPPRAGRSVRVRASLYVLAVTVATVWLTGPGQPP